MTPQFRDRQFLRITLPLLLFLLSVLLQTGLFAQETNHVHEANLAVSVEGKVAVKRIGFSRFTPVVFGTALRPGDLLRVEEASHIKIICSDLTLHNLEQGSGGVPCKVSQPLLSSPDGSLINPTRSWNAEAFPIVLSPRKTKLLSRLPVFRWTRVEDASTYSVTVRGGNLVWTTQVQSATEIIYPGTAPALISGVDYKLIIETGGRTSAAEPGPGLGFSILGATERDAVLKQEREIRNLGLADGPTQFVIAYLYATHGLKAEAIERLTSISHTLKVAAVSRLLADLYLETGISRSAEAFYLNSLTFSVAENDEEGEMLAHLALARIYGLAMGNRESATQHLEAALALAIRMGDDETVGQTKKQLAELKRTRTSKSD